MISNWLRYQKVIMLNSLKLKKILRNNNTFILSIPVATILLCFCLVSVGNANEWRLVWSDEFNYEGQPDSSIWLHEKGFSRSDTSYNTDRLENVQVKNGALIITARKENYTNGDDTANYTSGSLNTKGKKSFKYGRYEIRAKMPYGNGSHTGIWFSGANYDKVGWPENGEIDVAEYIGRMPDKIHIYNHYACPADDTHCKTTVGKFTVMNPYDSYHLYAMEWDETRIKYFIDNTHIATFNLDIAGTGPDNPYRKAQYFRLSFGLGGWGWDIDDERLPMKFEIDYIRVYKKVQPSNFSSMTPIHSLLLN